MTTPSASTKFIIVGNAVILAIATLLQVHAPAFKDGIMGLLFAAWIVLLVWHMQTAIKPESL